MVGTTGFEPATSSVSRKRSNQLSYAPIVWQNLVYQHRCNSKRHSLPARAVVYADSEVDYWLAHRIAVGREPAGQFLSADTHPTPREISVILVPKKGLEPPHPCEYVDLNHARLPIPPLRHERALKHVAPEQAATSSLANADRGVKFRTRIQWVMAEAFRPGPLRRLHQLRVQRDLRVIRKQYRDRASRLGVSRRLIKRFFRRARNARRRGQRDLRDREAPIHLG